MEALLWVSCAEFICSRGNESSRRRRMKRERESKRYETCTYRKKVGLRRRMFLSKKRRRRTKQIIKRNQVISFHVCLIHQCTRTDLLCFESYLFLGWTYRDRIWMIGRLQFHVILNLLLQNTFLRFFPRQRFSTLPLLYPFRFYSWKDKKHWTTECEMKRNGTNGICNRFLLLNSYKVIDRFEKAPPWIYARVCFRL